MFVAIASRLEKSRVLVPGDKSGYKIGLQPNGSSSAESVAQLRGRELDDPVGEIVCDATRFTSY